MEPFLDLKRYCLEYNHRLYYSRHFKRIKDHCVVHPQVYTVLPYDFVVERVTNYYGSSAVGDVVVVGADGAVVSVDSVVALLVTGDVSPVAAPVAVPPPSLTGVTSNGKKGVRLVSLGPYMACRLVQSEILLINVGSGISNTFEDGWKDALIQSGRDSKKSHTE